MKIIPDQDIFERKFNSVSDMLSYSFLYLSNFSFSLIFNNDIELHINSNDKKFGIFLDHWKNVYPVRFEKSEIKITGKELFFTRPSIYPLKLKFDPLSFLMNSFIENQAGFFHVIAERVNKIPFSMMHKIHHNWILEEKNDTVSKIILEKLNSEIFRVRMFISDTDLSLSWIDDLTKQSFSDHGKKIFMTRDEIVQFVHVPLTYKMERFL